MRTWAPDIGGVMRRRTVQVLLLALALVGTHAVARSAGPSDAAPLPPTAMPPVRPDPEARRRELEGWWERQREREAADRFWNGPREQRRNLTRDQIEFWERRKERRQRNPSWPF
jgi:hypothetical protein